MAALIHSFVVVVVVAGLWLASANDQDDAAGAAWKRGQLPSSSAWQRPLPAQAPSAGELVYLQAFGEQPTASSFRSFRADARHTLPILDKDELQRWIHAERQPAHDLPESDAMQLVPERAQLAQIRTRALRSSRSMPNPRQAPPQRPQLARCHSEQAADADGDRAANRFGWTPNPIPTAVPPRISRPWLRADSSTSSSSGGSRDAAVKASARDPLYKVPQRRSRHAAPAKPSIEPGSAAPDTKPSPSQATKPESEASGGRRSPPQKPSAFRIRDRRRYGVFASGQISR